MADPNTQQLKEALRATMSPERATRTAAESALQTVEAQPGFTLTLLGLIEAALAPNATPGALIGNFLWICNSLSLEMFVIVRQQRFACFVVDLYFCLFRVTYETLTTNLDRGQGSAAGRSHLLQEHGQATVVTRGRIGHS